MKSLFVGSQALKPNIANGKSFAFVNFDRKTHFKHSHFVERGKEMDDFYISCYKTQRTWEKYLRLAHKDY